MDVKSKSIFKVNVADTPVTWNKDIVIKPGMHQQNPSKVITYTKFERLRLNNVQENANAKVVKSGNINYLSWRHAKVKQKWYIHDKLV